jgi:hypothetical protein
MTQDNHWGIPVSFKSALPEFTRMHTNNLTRCLSVLVLVLGSAQFSFQVHSQTKPIKKDPGGTVSGRITLQGKGRGGIVVGLNKEQTGPQTGPVFKATSDADGRYRITDVPAGFYRVVPMAPDYVIPEVNVNTFGFRGKALHLAEGETVDGIDFSIARGSVITGKVTYSDGQPVIEERVMASLVRQMDERGPVYFQPSLFQTDDRGVYRIYGLLAGQYKVSVGQSPDAMTTGNRNRPAFERVFFPDATDTNEAKVIELGEGDEATNIDITVGRNLRGFMASGLIVDGETNQPVAGVRFGLQRYVGQQRTFVGTSAISDQRGEFRIENVLPGKYSVIIMPQPSNQVQADPVAFEIVDQDVGGLTVRTSKGASIAGVVIIEGTYDKTVLARLAQLRLQVFVRNERSVSGGSQQALLNQDGSFRLGGVPAGTANFFLSGQDYSQPKGFSLTRVEHDGVVQPRGLEVKAGEQVSGVRIIFTYATGVVRGQVNIANGPLPIGARVMVRLAKVGDNSSLRPQEADARGYFIIDGVPAGSYDLFVSTFLPGSRQRPPSAKQSVSVADGGVTEVVVVLDLNPKSDSAPNP